MKEALITNRTKKNFKTYKEACEALKENVYKRGSEEKQEQLKRWEIQYNLIKQKDNSFTCINTEFKPQKKIEKEDKRSEKTVIIDNRPVFVGVGKYKFKEFNHMQDIFLKFIECSEAKTKRQYVEDFFKECLLFRMSYNNDFKEKLGSSKVISISWDVFFEECKYVFNYFLKKSRNYIWDWITYYDYDNEEVNAVMCDAAIAQAKDELGFNYIDYKRRPNELYHRIDEILMENGENPVKRRETQYGIMEYTQYFMSEFNEQQYIEDMSKLLDIIKYTVIEKLKKKERKAAIGVKRVKSYELNTSEFLEAKEFIEQYVYLQRK